MTLQILKELGFSDKETEIYLALLEQGRLTPAKIAQSTGINRTTVYSSVQELIEKGLVTENRSEKTLQYSALPLSSMQDMIFKEERKLKNKKILVEQAIEKLDSITKNAKTSIPKLTFIYEEHLLDFLYKQTPFWNQSMMRRDGIWWGFQNPTFLKTYESWVNWYWEQSTPKNMILRLLTNQSEFEKRMRNRGYARRLIKFWKGGKDFTATTWVIGDYIIMIATDQKPHYLVQIHDEVLANNMKELFKSIWEAQDLL
jgi:predicted transcriptional regulator